MTMKAFLGARCLAAPVLSPNRTAIAGIHISGPTARMTAERFPPMRSGHSSCRRTNPGPARDLAAAGRYQTAPSS